MARRLFSVSDLARAAVALAGLTLTLTFTLGACTATQDGRALYTARDPDAAAQQLQVAEGERTANRNELVVDATVPRTSLGHFRTGDHIRVRVLDGKWRHAAGAEAVSAVGQGVNCQGAPGHACAAGENLAPGMGLMLFARPSRAPRPACVPSQRLIVPSGVEFSMPQDAFLFAAPNDWEDGVYDNAGAIATEVEVSANQTSPVLSKRKVSVEATAARTPLGFVSAGMYLRFSVLSGSWTHAPGAATVGSDGGANARCTSDGNAHPCSGGEDRAPLMALVLVMASCEDGGIARPVVDERRYIPQGVDFVVEHDGEVSLGPNDWEDGCHDNSGFIRVEVVTELR